MRLGLGTVQFGRDYGVSNRSGKTPYTEVEKILAFAALHGIRLLDTAPAYGASEEILGKILSREKQFSIVTKTPKFDDVKITIQNAEVVENSLLRSLQKLEQSQVYGLLIHHADNLLSPGGELLFSKLLDLKRQGLVEKIGFSAYTSRQVKQISGRFSFDIVQLPFNVFDQRMRSDGCLKLLKMRGVEIHARSVFLQGLLLMRPEHLPNYFSPIKAHLEKYHRHVRDRGISPVRAALGFALDTEELDVVLCGVTSLQELTSIISEGSLPFDGERIDGFAIEEQAFLNPSYWSL